MSRSDLAHKTCSIARTIEIIGNEWSLMILREMFLGSRRFDDLQRQTGASTQVLSQRLRRLVSAGILRREAYSTRPARYEYRLTRKGCELWPVIVAMKTWGDAWLADGRAPVEIVHEACGRTVDPQMTCPYCGEPMTAHDARAKLSPAIASERGEMSRDRLARK